MSDGITDGTYQSKIPEINLKRTTDHKNVYADTAIYQVMATFGAEPIQIFEADNKERAQAFIDSIISNGYLKTLNPTLNIVYVNHSIIEDGYYTYSHIYENGQTINFTIYNTPLTYNVADVIQGWQGYVVQFSTDVSHWWYDNHVYAWSADGKDRFTNLNLINQKDLEPGYINNTGGITPPSAEANERTSPFLEVDVSQSYTAQIFVTLGTQRSSWCGISWFDENQIFIKRNTFQESNVPISGKYTYHYTVQPPSNAKFVRISFRKWNDGKLKFEQGSTATPWIPSASELQPSEYPQFIGTQHTPIGYLHDDPKWYEWQPFTGTLSVSNTHTEFSFSTKLWDTMEEIKAIAPINKRNIRNDNWKYQPNETYPFIGGYES
jgi:disulfide oxidoreductase YuzD